jgi:protein-disulfide isomerase
MRVNELSRRTVAGLALLPLFCRAAGAVEAGDRARIEQEAIKAYLAKDQAEKAAASDALVAKNRAALYDNPASGFLGNPKGDVILVQFFDYDCGFSKRVEPRVEALLKADPGVKLIPREFTIEPAESSPIAGRAALASIKQGKYAEYHQAMMVAPEHPLPTPRVFDIAQKVGLDVDRLRVDMEKPEIYAQLLANFNLARALRIFQTPTFIIGNHIITEPSAQIDFPALVAKARANKA